MIIFAVLLVVITLAVTMDTVRTTRQRRLETVQRDSRRPSTPVAAAPDDLAEAERRLAARRFSGELDAAGYRTEVEELARRLDNKGVPAQAVRATVIDKELLANAGRVGVIAPQLPLPMLTAVAGVVRYGAEDDDLIRMFGVTRVQAFKIMMQLHSDTRPGT